MELIKWNIIKEVAVAQASHVTSRYATMHRSVAWRQGSCNGWSRDAQAMKALREVHMASLEAEAAP